MGEPSTRKRDEDSKFLPILELKMHLLKHTKRFNINIFKEN